MDLGLDLGDDPKRLTEAMERVESLALKYRMPLLTLAAENARRVIASWLTSRICGFYRMGLIRGIRRARRCIENYQ